jgi:hypothetical protein
MANNSMDQTPFIASLGAALEECLHFGIDAWLVAEVLCGQH